MGSLPLVSIIMPAFNAAETIAVAVESVLRQSWAYWELIVVDDGSEDGTGELVSSFGDPRVRLIAQSNGGVSSARNTGLAVMEGEYFCFLDADDRLPERSIAARAQLLLDNPNVYFADGVVEFMSADLSSCKKLRTVNFSGKPLKNLAMFKDDCFFGNTWMIRRGGDAKYRFDTELTHCEDLMFYLQIATDGDYLATSETVLQYRTGRNSAMADFEGLARGYAHVLEYVRSQHHLNAMELVYARLRVTRIMTLSYLSRGQWVQAMRSFFGFIFIGRPLR